MDHFFYDGKLDLFDQLIVSRGLLNGVQGLEIDLDSIKIDKTIAMQKQIENGKFGLGENQIHPINKISSTRFVYQKISNGIPERLPPGRDDLTGFSDHFPIQSSINIVRES